MDKDVQQLDSGVSPERLRHEQEQAHFNELYLLAPCGYFVVSFDGRILQANVAGAQLIGVPRGAAGGRGDGGAAGAAGCDYAQGYMFGRPMTALELEKLALTV